MSKTPKPTVRKVLDVSTGHIPGAVRDGLLDNTAEAWGTLRVVDHEYGYVVFLPSKGVDADVPDWLKTIFKAAMKKNALLINFDADADLVDGWEEYE